MNLENFSLLEESGYQTIEILHLNNVYDLHNAAEFTGFDYSVRHTELDLNWTYFLDEKKVRLTVHFSKVSQFEVHSRDTAMPFTEDDCLKEIVNGDSLRFEFMGGMKIIVTAEKAKVQVSDPDPQQ